MLRFLKLTLPRVLVALYPLGRKLDHRAGIFAYSFPIRNRSERASAPLALNLIGIQPPQHCSCVDVLAVRTSPGR